MNNRHPVETAGSFNSDFPRILRKEFLVSLMLGGALALVVGLFSWLFRGEQAVATYEKAVQTAHVELTCLIIPGENDSPEEMRQMCRWIESLRDADGYSIGQDIPLHISRFFPQFHMTDRPATEVGHIYHLADIAREYLHYVYTGNC